MQRGGKERNEQLWGGIDRSDHCGSADVGTAVVYSPYCVYPLRLFGGTALITVPIELITVNDNETGRRGKAGRIGGLLDLLASASVGIHRAALAYLFPRPPNLVVASYFEYLVVVCNIGKIVYGLLKKKKN